MLRYLSLAMLCVLLVAAIVIAAEQTVTLKDGGKITGEVTKTKDGYKIKTTTGVELVVRADQVVSITETTTPQAEYEKRLSRIDKADPDARVALAEWAMSQNLNDIAAAELKAALELKPGHEKAQLLSRQVEARIRAATTTAPPETRPTTGRPVVEREMLVSDEDIFRIRLAETVSLERTTAVRFRNNVVERFLESVRGRTDIDPRQFRARQPWEQAQDILNYIDPDDYAIKDDILIQSDPKAIVDFRTRIWPIVLQGCAAAACHGSPKGKGGLKLFRTPPSNDNIDYTNFLILSTLVSRNRRMVDRDTPELSLVLQMGLPQEEARYPHPTKISPAFTGKSDRKYQMITEWIDALKRPRPSYRLEYKPPFGMNLQMMPRLFPPASGPAGETATAPAAGPFGP